jgi:hypothetical protein
LEASIPHPNEIDMATVREAFGRVVYTHKTHEKAREIESRKVHAVKWFNILLTVATAGSVFSALVTNEHVLIVIGAIVSAFAVAFVVFQLSFDPARAEENHRATAKQLWYIRERYEILIADLAEGSVAREELMTRRDGLLDELQVIYSQAPNTSSRAYKAAQKALKVSEDMTFSDEELDQCLWRAYRRPISGNRP